jgi:hypothetical protein
MSTIMMFSARFFSDSRNAFAWASSSSKVSPRGAVPFIGRDTMRSPSSRKNSSGEAEQTQWVSVFTKAQCDACCAAASA